MFNWGFLWLILEQKSKSILQVESGAVNRLRTDRKIEASAWKIGLIDYLGTSLLSLEDNDKSGIFFAFIDKTAIILID